MEFRLPVPPIKADFSISHHDPVLLLGSCFSENIGQKLTQAGFHTCPGPHGIIYNPISLFGSLRETIQGKPYTEQDLKQRGEFFFSFRHHGSFSDITAKACLDKINAALAGAHAFLPQCNTFILTLGTAFVYEHTETGTLVANCHKLPASAFRKRLLSAAEIVEAFADIRELIPPAARILFTVSPVRHWKDGAVENARSKAVLITALHEIIGQFNGCHYFPAFELLIDDLRDYRFYAQDMVHPNDLAVEYIWERFSEAYFEPLTQELASMCQSLNQARQHRPLFPESEAYAQFQRDLDRRLADLRARYPFIRM